MDFTYCPNCGKTTGHKRALGWGTFFAVLITGGLWLLAIPFYPKRCIICGADQSSSSSISWPIWILLGLTALLVLLASQNSL